MHADMNNSSDINSALRGSLPHRLRSGWAVLLAAGALLIAGPATLAHAGEWVQVSCTNPDGAGAGSSGWLSMIGGGGYGSNTDTACGPGAPMYAILSADAAVGTGSAETLRYIPPAGSTLNGGELDVSLFADGGGYDASGTAVLYTPEYIYDGSNVFFQCAAGLTPCAPGSNDFNGTLGIPAGRGGELYVSAGCGGAPGASCSEHPSHGAWSLVQVSAAKLRLRNSSTPGASSITGALLEESARGAGNLAVTATDPGGPGVYTITVQADGQTLYSGTPESNDGQCAAVGASGGALMFDASQPCKQNEQVNLPVDTTALKDGAHTLTVTVTDAAQNHSVVLERTVTTFNAPSNTLPPSTVMSVAPDLTTTVSALPGSWSAPAGAGQPTFAYQWERCDGAGNGCAPIAGASSASYTALAADVGHTVRVLVTASDSDGSQTLASVAVAAGAPNGLGASESARIRLTGSNTLKRPYARRALTITGRLETNTGSPIAAARLEVTQQPGSSGAAREVSSGSDGSFAVHVPAGGSRSIVISYRARSSDALSAAQASVRETVSAGVHIDVFPSHTGSAGTITIHGSVGGPVPREGLTVEVLVHYRGQWEPFREVHVNRNGRFRVRYQFQGATGGFPFRAKVIGQQGGYPYSTGESNTVTVSTR